MQVDIPTETPENSRNSDLNLHPTEIKELVETSEIGVNICNLKFLLI
ncbi:MAG: hypothetical protein Kow00121_16060 [Elainellaceae cyanobacterium]